MAGHPITWVSPRRSPRIRKEKRFLLYPIRFGSEPDWLTTNEISIAITHAEYVKNELHIDPTVGESVKELKAGCELTVSARDASMQSTKEFGILLAGPGQSAKWIMDDQGSRDRDPFRMVSGR